MEKSIPSAPCTGTDCFLADGSLVLGMDLLLHALVQIASQERYSLLWERILLLHALVQIASTAIAAAAEFGSFCSMHWYRLLRQGCTNA